MLYGQEQDVITLITAKPIVKKQIDYPVPTHKILTKNTTWNHLLPCGVYFNEQEELNKALKCVNKKVYNEEQISFQTIAPRCFIISASSPDVYSNNGVNFVPLVTFFERGSVLGYFDTDTETLFVVENLDAAAIYRHELQHYFLKLKGGDGGGHYQDIWKQCEPPYYTASDKVKILNKMEKIEKIEELENSKK
jgi:hypothetical protein